MEKLNIFIVEDESIVAKDIQNSLTKLGYNVVGMANNGKDAVEKIIEMKPDLVLMDIMIKGNMTGIEVSEKILRKELSNRADQENYILDFFAGSGTTAHAVLDLNKEDNGNRKFILVQLPEPTELRNKYLNGHGTKIY